MSSKALASNAPLIYSLPRKVKVLVTLLFFVLVYSTVGHVLIFKMSVPEALVETISTLALHYTVASTAIGEAFQVSVVIFGVIALWWAVWTTFDLIVEGKFKQYFSEVKEMSDISKLNSHYIICGAGRVGLHTAKLLALEKKPFVLVDIHEEDSENAKKKGFLVVKGDPIEEEILMKCGLTHAKALIAVMSETEKNILATLIAKQFNPGIKVYARTEKEELINTLKKVGADHVIMPEAAGAIDISRAITRDEKECEDERLRGKALNMRLSDEVRNVKAKIAGKI